MRNTLRIGKIAGIDIGVHYSWFVGVTYFLWSLRSRFLPSLYEGWSPATFWAMGVAAALLLYASVLVHELAHSVVARRLGVEVEGNALFLLGGASSLKTEPKRPRDEFVISISGPAMSLPNGSATFETCTDPARGRSAGLTSSSRTHHF